MGVQSGEVVVTAGHDGRGDRDDDARRDATTTEDGVDQRSADAAVVSGVVALVRVVCHEGAMRRQDVRPLDVGAVADGIDEVAQGSGRRDHRDRRGIAL